MKPDNATQPENTGHATKSGREVAEKSGRENQSTGKSKFSRDYWLGKVYRSTAPDPDGGRMELPEFWARIQHAGERRAVPLASTDRQSAARTAAKLYAAVRDKGWQLGLAAALPGQAERQAAAVCQTFGDHLAAALAAKAGDVRPVTLQGYASSARQLVALVVGGTDDAAKYAYRSGARAKWAAKIEATRADKITTEAMQAAVAAKVAAARPDAMKERSTKRTAACVVRESKALFKGQAWNPFAALKAENPAAPAYQGAVNMPALLRAGMALESTDPQLLAALLLMAGAGLRKSEADAARWSWLDVEACKLSVTADATFTPKTVASEAPVLVDASFLAALVKLRPADAAPDAYILAPEAPAQAAKTFVAYRAEKVFDRLSAWLRQQGLTGRTPLHDLRREFGSFIAQNADIFTASRQLRHGSIQVTASHYTAQRRHVAPSLATMLAVPAEPATAAKP